MIDSSPFFWPTIVFSGPDHPDVGTKPERLVVEVRLKRSLTDLFAGLAVTAYWCAFIACCRRIGQSKEKPHGTRITLIPASPTN